MSMPSDVIRHVSFDELPSSVRQIPHDLNPLADGILMAHQIDWIKLCGLNDLMIAEKGRRTGVTYATALDCTITAASQLSAGGDDVYYVGDTKEKGLEFIGYCAHMAKVMSHAMADGWDGIEVFLFEDKPTDGSRSKYITAYRIRFASGFKIVALSSNPAGIRGLQGIVIIDEAAFHANVKAVIEAATALIIWGGKIRIISTHNGADNAFNELIKDSNKGLNDFKVFQVFFDDAVANGLFERVCLVRGWKPTEQRKRDWYNKVRGAYGSNRTGMLQELDGIPSEGTGVAIPGILIENCMHEERPILRLSLDNAFALKSKSYKKSWCKKWITENLLPLLKKLNPNLKHVFGEDFARHGDFSVIAPMAIEQNLKRTVPFLIEMKNVPTAQQQQVLFATIRGLPNWYAGAMDASGNGETLAEYTADEFGHSRIAQVKLNNAWYRTNMQPFKDSFVDQVIDLPMDADIVNDIRGLQMIDGIIKPPKLRQQDTKNKKFFRHCDAAIALAMAWYACSMMEPSAGVTIDASPDDFHRINDQTYLPSAMKNRKRAILRLTRP